MDRLLKVGQKSFRRLALVALLLGGLAVPVGEAKADIGGNVIPTGEYCGRGNACAGTNCILGICPFSPNGPFRWCFCEVG